VVEAPEQSDIQNVLAMHEPQHMLSKLLWEIRELTSVMSVWADNDEFPVPIFIAFNAAVTAWHITDWLWQSRPETRAVLAKRFNFTHAETKNGLRVGLERFQDAMAADCRALYVCREIANGSKHMRKTKIDPDVKAIAQWHQAIERVGFVKPGDRVMGLMITYGQDERDAIKWFIEAFGYWENLFTAEKLITAEARLPDKIIRAQR
jgi:hypothetical protein